MGVKVGKDKVSCDNPDCPGPSDLLATDSTHGWLDVRVDRVGVSSAFIVCSPSCAAAVVGALPHLKSVSVAGGRVGEDVVIETEGLGSVDAVLLAGAAAQFKATKGGKITATIPSTPTDDSGPIVIHYTVGDETRALYSPTDFAIFADPDYVAPDAA